MAEKSKIIQSLGVMTGTSCDGIDMALIRTDGVHDISPLQFESSPFTPSLAHHLIALGQKARQIGLSILDDPATDAIITAYSHEVANAIIKKFPDQDYDIASIHGQTIYHNPAKGETLQIIDADLISSILNKPVIYDFRTADMKVGGQGAPFAPLYHKAMLKKYMPEKNSSWVNIGGVANVTYFNHATDQITGWDTGMGCGLIDALCHKHFNKAYDHDGAYAAQGQIDTEHLEKLCAHNYFHTAPPKSLDRNDFTIHLFDHLSPLDAIATATAFTAETIIMSDHYCSEKPEMRLISGGGAKNKTLMKHLSEKSHCPVFISDHAGHPYNAIEAECFAWLGVRSLYKLPLSAPSVTGAQHEVTGGQQSYPAQYKKILNSNR